MRTQVILRPDYKLVIEYDFILPVREGDYTIYKGEEKKVHSIVFDLDKNILEVII